eukprot:PhM_4_TR5752/c0_g1_i1/m.35064
MSTTNGLGYKNKQQASTMSGRDKALALLEVSTEARDLVSTWLRSSPTSNQLNPTTMTTAALAPKVGGGGGMKPMFAGIGFTNTSKRGREDDLVAAEDGNNLSHEGPRIPLSQRKDALRRKVLGGGRQQQQPQQKQKQKQRDDDDDDDVLRPGGSSTSNVFSAKSRLQKLEEERKRALMGGKHK